MDTQTLAQPADGVVAEVRRTCALLYQPGDVVELRALDAEIRPGYRRTVSGYYVDHDQLAVDAAEISGNAAGVYVTLNPVRPELLARSCNRFKIADRGATTSDDCILGRRWLLVDLDPVRPSGISASDDELAAALERGYQVRAWFWEQDWPRPLMAMSGNGCHLLFPIDLPAADDGAVKGILEDVAQRFPSTETGVAIDTTVHNAARITKCIGTETRKGDPLPDRPHRLSHWIEVP